MMVQQMLELILFLIHASLIVVTDPARGYKLLSSLFIS